MEGIEPAIVPQRRLSNEKVFLWESAKDWRDIWDREDE